MKNMGGIFLKLEHLYTWDMPEIFKITDTSNNKIYRGSSKEIDLIAIKLDKGYYLKFKNSEFIFKLLTKEFTNFIDKILKINSINIKMPNNIMATDNLMLLKNLLDDSDNFKIINTYLFVFIYYWFTELPLSYLSPGLHDGSGKKINQITSKYLTIKNGDKSEHIINRNDESNYIGFNIWLNEYYKNKGISFISLINNENLHSIDENGNKIYTLYGNEGYIIEEVNPKNNKQFSIEELRKMPYEEYLQTGHWQNIRKQALFRAKYKCQLCSNKGKLFVHHNTYENRGEEKDEDLIVLCKDCHEKFHFNK